MKMKKKGELTTQQIVILIILLVSFVIILFLLFRLDLGEESDSELCHNSVIMRGSSVIPTDAVPLKCSRNYLCITKDGSCEGMTKPELKKVKTEEEIYDVLAEEMADCWWMFGEGKVNYVTATMTKNNYCSICSQILFDNSLKEIKNESEMAAFPKGEISKDNFYNYLSKKTMSDKGISYSQYLLGTNDINGLKTELSKNATKDVSFGTIKIGEQSFIVMGITTEVNTIGWVVRGAALGGVLVVGLATAGVGTAGFIAVLAGEAAAGGAGLAGAGIANAISPKIEAITIEGDGIKNKFMVPTIQGANSGEFEALNCEEIITTS